MNHRAFTLIELLVVVAIIGILAAVGVNTFTGFQEKAKIAVSKSNHKNVIKYMTVEITKCELGEETVMDGNLTCSGRTRQSVIDATVKALSDFKNPYGEPNQGVHDKDDKAVTDGGSYSSDHGVGYVRLQNQSAKVLRIGTCYAIPCYASKTNYNYLETDIQVLE